MSVTTTKRPRLTVKAAKQQGFCKRQRLLEVARLVKLLSDRRGAQFVTITAKTNENGNMLKRNNPLWDRVTKVSRVNVVINFNYSNSVNRQREREGNQEHFTAKPRKWGERMKGLPFVIHKGNLYLETKVEKVLETQYFVDDKPVDKSVVEPYLKAKSSNKAHQGVEKEIVLRDYKFLHNDGSSIVQIAFRNRFYVIPETQLAA